MVSIGCKPAYPVMPQSRHSVEYLVIAIVLKIGIKDHMPQSPFI
jgi:hypothetical protein